MDWRWVGSGPMGVGEVGTMIIVYVIIGVLIANVFTFAVLYGIFNWWISRNGNGV